MEWEPLIQAFLQQLSVERQYAAHTLAAYQRDLNQARQQFEQWQLSPDQLTAQHLRHWIAHAHQQGLSGRSIARSLSALRSFFHYLVRQHQLPNNPALGLQAPKQEKRLPKSLDPERAEQLVNLPGDDWLAVRDRLLLELLYGAGLRVSELANLELSQIDLSGRQLRITGKGNKTRLLPLGRCAEAALRQWLPLRQARCRSGHDRLLLNAQGGPLSVRSIQLRVKQHGITQGIEQPVHPHMLRHSFASHILESSGDLRGVQELLGHADLSTTQIYTHLDFQRLAAVYDQSHPRARRQTSSTPSSTSEE